MKTDGTAVVLTIIADELTTYRGFRIASVVASVTASATFPSSRAEAATAIRSME